MLLIPNFDVSETRNLDNNNLTRFPLDASLQGVRRLFVLPFSNTTVPANIRLGEEVLKTSSRRLQDVFSVTFFCLPRRLEDVLKT